ncbi:MAG: phage tail sheath family protein, partial [Eubacteriales bacterium]
MKPNAMAEYLSPGVYVEEYDNSPRTLEGIGTSTAGFVGMAVKGQTVGAPSLVVNFGEFKKQFGGYLSEYTHEGYRYLAYAVEQFFTNGGTRCYVARVAPADATAASITMGGVTMTAKNVGKWGNKIMVTFTSAERKKFQLTSKVNETVFVAKSVDGLREGDVLRYEGQTNKIVNIFENTLTFADAFEADPTDSGLLATKILKLVELDIQVAYDREVENYAGVTMNTMSPNFFMQRLKSSNMVEVTVEELEGDLITKVFGSGAVTGTMTLEGGSDGTMGAANAGTFIGEDNGPGKRTGIASFVENSVVSMMAVPGVTAPEVMVSLVA